MIIDKQVRYSVVGVSRSTGECVFFAQKELSLGLSGVWPVAVNVGYYYLVPGYLTQATVSHKLSRPKQIVKRSRKLHDSAGDTYTLVQGK